MALLPLLDKKITSEKRVEKVDDAEQSEAEMFIINNMNDKTLASYQSSFSVFEKWCEERKIQVLPVSVSVVEKYVVWMATAWPGREPVIYKASTVQKHVSAINHFNVLKGFEEMSKMANAARLMKLVGVVKKKLEQPTPKKAFCVEDMTKLCAVLAENKKVEELGKDKFVNVRAGAAIFLSFTGGFRASELCEMKWENIKIVQDIAKGEQYLELKMIKRKNDQLRKGSSVIIANLDVPWSPMRWVLKLQELAKKEKLSPTFLFHNMKELEKGKQAHIKYGSMYHWFKKWMENCGMDAGMYGTHSGRRGGTTLLAEQGASEVELKAHGGWRSNAFQRYVEKRSESKVSAAKKMKIGIEATEQKLKNVGRYVERNLDEEDDELYLFTQQVLQELKESGVFNDEFGVPRKIGNK
jgi:integrase